MSRPTSDAAFELIGVCVHSLRFSFGAPLGYPHAPALPDERGLPPALFRRIQAASPPPRREGEPWYAGMTLAGEPFRPNGASSLEQLAAVGHETGIAGLDAADPETVVLDEWIRVERLEAPKAVSFPGDDHGRYLVSIDYWSPVPDDQESVEKAVRYYGEYRMAWTQAPGDQWVAVSFDAFWPPERDSADLIIPIGACDSRCPA